VDITPVFEQKRKAMEVMQAQSYLQNYYAELAATARQPCPPYIWEGQCQIRGSTATYSPLGGVWSMRIDELARLSELGVATVYEAAGREGLIDIPLIQLMPGSRVAGSARTVLCGQDDNLMVHAVIEHIQPGEVLVLAIPEPRPVALLGELLATQIKVRGAAGILVDAAVRDVTELVELGLPDLDAFRPGERGDQDESWQAQCADICGRDANLSS
jgi:hypothetical protein